MMFHPYPTLPRGHLAPALLSTQHNHKYLKVASGRPIPLEAMGQFEVPVQVGSDICVRVCNGQSIGAKEPSSALAGWGCSASAFEGGRVHRV